MYLKNQDFVWNTERAINFTDAERRYDVVYFLTVCTLDKYRIIALIF